MNSHRTPLDAIDADSGLVNVVIDTPRGSRCKFKFHEKTGKLTAAIESAHGGIAGLRQRL